jgi:hypothetical protein
MHRLGVVLTAGQPNPARRCKGLKYCHFAVHAVSGRPRNPAHQEPQMLCHNQTPSSARMAICLIDSPRLNEVYVIPVVITIENAEIFSPRWGQWKGKPFQAYAGIS